jgi:hypothetical protein
MEAKYKLKKEARQFFDSKYHTAIYPLSIWQKEGIPIQLLEEVQRVHIQSGHKKECSDGTEYTNISSWNKDRNHSSEFMFTVHVKDVKCSEHDKISVAEMMDEMQRVLNRYFKQQ